MTHKNDVHFLVQALTCAADEKPTTADRREALLLLIAERIRADMGHWAWGRGAPDRNSLAVVANIPFGYTSEELRGIFAFGMCEVCQTQFVVPQFKRRRDDGMIACLRSDIISDSEWTESNPIRQGLAAINCSSWVNVVRYSSDDTWSQLLFFRRLGQPEFAREELDLVDLAVSTISWLWATTEERVAPEAIVGLTPRQRNVMLLLLSGLSRKMIARRLGIAEATVHDHVNSVFSHFNVHSATELAALFLRSQ